VTEGRFDAVGLLRRAVATPSPSGQEAEVARVLVDAMATFADEAFVDEAGNAVGVWGEGALAVTVLGHIDTVPGVVPVREEGGVLHGRGAVDAKGSFCAAVGAVAGLAPELRSALRVRLIGAVEEEAPSSKGARHAVRAYERPDLVIIGEPSGWDAYTLGYKGRLLVRLEAERPNTHSSRDEPTAPELAVRAYGDVRAFVEADNEPVEGVFDALQLSLQSLDSSNDGLTQRCVAVLGFRLPPRWPPEALVARLEGLALPAGVELVASGPEHAYRGPRDSALARAFRVGIRQAGGRPRAKVKTGTSDMNVVAPDWPVPMVAYGPGDSALDHTPDERIELSEYSRAVEVLRAVFTRLAGASASPDKS
jgi:[amino group carrier protein]-lysine/ornithine hydrolase